MARPATGRERAVYKGTNAAHNAIRLLCAALVTRQGRGQVRPRRTKGSVPAVAGLTAVAAGVLPNPAAKQTSARSERHTHTTAE